MDHPVGTGVEARARAAIDKTVIGVDAQYKTLMSVLYQVPYGKEKLPEADEGDESTASADSDEAEERDLFNQVCEEIDLPISQAMACNSIEEVLTAADELGKFPILIRPAFTLGG